jgi:hypothetical protein
MESLFVFLNNDLNFFFKFEKIINFKNLFRILKFIFIKNEWYFNKFFKYIYTKPLTLWLLWFQKIMN